MAVWYLLHVPGKPCKKNMCFAVELIKNQFHLSVISQESLLPKKPERTVKERVVVQKVETPISATTDRQLLDEFLLGEYCIQGVRFISIL